MSQIIYIQILISSLSLIISICGLYYLVKNWRESNRPIIFVRLKGDGSNHATVLTLNVINQGNRPAKNIILSIPGKELSAAISSECEDLHRQDIEKCFAKRGIIDILGVNETVSNSFGILRKDEGNTWVLDSVINIEISYEDIENRKFRSQVPVRIKNPSGGFAGGSWN